MQENGERRSCKRSLLKAKNSLMQLCELMFAESFEKHKKSRRCPEAIDQKTKMQ